MVPLLNYFENFWKVEQHNQQKGQKKNKELNLLSKAISGKLDKIEILRSKTTMKILISSVTTW